MMNFYVFRTTSEPVEVTKVSYKHRECMNCGLRPLGRVGSISIEFSSRHQYSDVSWSEGIYLTDNLFEVLYESKIIGWRKGELDVTVSSQIKNPTNKYSELIIIGRTQDYARKMGLALIDYCDQCGYRKYEYPKHGLEIPLECWDNSDIFYIDEFPGIPIISEDFKKVISKNNPTGVKLIDVSEWRPPSWANY